MALELESKHDGYFDAIFLQQILKKTAPVLQSKNTNDILLPHPASCRSIEVRERDYERRYQSMGSKSFGTASPRPGFILLGRRLSDFALWRAQILRNAGT